MWLSPLHHSSLKPLSRIQCSCVYVHVCVLHAYMYDYVCVCVIMWVVVCLCVIACRCMCVLYANMYVCLCVLMCVCTRVYVCYMRVCLCIHMYVCGSLILCVCVHIYPPFDHLSRTCVIAFVLLYFSLSKNRDNSSCCYQRPTSPSAAPPSSPGQKINSLSFMLWALDFLFRVLSLLF